MLVLSRKPGELITIGGDVRVYILKVFHDGRVRVGIDAPKDVPVHRGEVSDRTDREGKANG